MGYDRACPNERSFVHLRNLGKHVQMVLFPGGDHNLSRGGPALQRVERLEVIRDWFVDRLGLDRSDPHARPAP